MQSAQCRYWRLAGALNLRFALDAVSVITGFIYTLNLTDFFFDFSSQDVESCKCCQLIVWPSQIHHTERPLLFTTQWIAR